MLVEICGLKYQFCQIKKWIKTFFRPGAVAQAYNPSTLGGRGGDHEVRRSRPSWSTWGNPVSTKNTKISWARWHVPVIQLLGRLRQENCLNPGGGGCCELRSRHCTPVWVTRAKLRLKKKIFFQNLK